MRVTGQAGQMVCYHCQQPGHMRRDWPQRQGSLGFGTTQSQSVAHRKTNEVLENFWKKKKSESSMCSLWSQMICGWGLFESMPDLKFLFSSLWFFLVWSLTFVSILFN